MRHEIKRRLRELNGADVARQVGVSRQAVHMWKQTGRIGPLHVHAVAQLIGLTPHQIRPDVFRPEAAE